ncbi:MAG: ABC transporter ATP-binding protein, partial [Thermoplasmatota archaeon]
LADAINKKVGEFSKGMKQRLGMARAVLGNPPILILDEPSSGLDPRGVVFIREKIRKMKENGATVFVSSHILNEIQEICDRVGIINKGKIVAEDTIANLGDTLQLKPKILIQLQNITDEIISSIKEIDGVSYVNKRHNYLEVICPPSIKAKVIVAVVKQGGNIINLQTREPSLEDVFMKFTEET